MNPYKIEYCFEVNPKMTTISLIRQQNKIYVPTESNPYKTTYIGEQEVIGRVSVWKYDEDLSRTFQEVEFYSTENKKRFELEKQKRLEQKKKIQQERETLLY